ncbi:MAG: maleylpyruvate isomerase family mycothiol-dependent enzyme [Pseudonocardiaceae bacterium]
MEAIVLALRAEHRELDVMLNGLTQSEWERPSRCPGWSVSDVVLHLAQTDELTLASATGRFADAFGEVAVDVDTAAALAVERERGPVGVAVRDRWRAAAEAVAQMFEGCDPSSRLVWVAGELSARTFATTRLSETWIHSGDIAQALGRELPVTDRLWHIARLAWRTLPYAFARSGQELRGPVAVYLTAPDGSIWSFEADSAITTVRGPALDFCLVAGRRLAPTMSSLEADGPDAHAVLELLRTYA